MIKNKFTFKSREMLSVSLEQNGHTELLKDAYESIYVPAFPIDDERAPLDLWHAQLQAGLTADILKGVIFIAGQNLLTPEQREIDAISVGLYAPEVQVGLLAYNATAPESRRQGLGREMVAAREDAFHGFAREQGKKLRGMFLEVNDPLKVTSEEDPMAFEKVKLFENWGARKIPIDYVQPALGEGMENCDKADLYAFPDKDGNYPSASAIMDMISTLTRYSGLDPEENAEFIRARMQLENFCQVSSVAFDAPMNVIHSIVSMPQLKMH